MQFIAPLPFQEAIDKLDDKSLIGSQLSSSEWSDVPVELRDRAFFSSRVESVQQLQRMQNLIGDFLAGEHISNGPNETLLSVGSRAAFVNQMQQYLAASGIDRTTGDLQDITSQPRLGIIFDTQVRSAQDFGHWKQGMDPDLLDAFPAQRFIRVQDVKEPRQSHEQYQDQVYLKTDPIWQLVINHDFGVPWGPWGWGCGHDVEDVDRPTAERLNLLRPGQRLQPSKFGFNHNLGASIKRLDPDLVDKLRGAFGNQITIQGDMIRWTKAAAPAVPAPAPAVVPVPVPAPSPVPRASRPTLAQILAEVGLTGEAKATPELMGALREALREETPALESTVITSIVGADPSGNLSAANIRQVTQSFLDFFPPDLIKSLPSLKILVRDFDARGEYDPDRLQITLNQTMLSTSAQQLRRTLFHELMHWVHMEGPATYRDLIFAHFQARTAGDKIKYLAGYGDAIGLADDWYDAYAGRIYPASTKYGNQGLEIPTRYIEWLAMHPDDMADYWGRPKFRETMTVVLQSLF